MWVFAHDVDDRVHDAAQAVALLGVLLDIGRGHLALEADEASDAGEVATVAVTDGEGVNHFMDDHAKDLNGVILTRRDAHLMLPVSRAFRIVDFTGDLSHLGAAARGDRASEGEVLEGDRAVILGERLGDRINNRVDHAGGFGEPCLAVLGGRDGMKSLVRMICDHRLHFIARRSGLKGLLWAGFLALFLLLINQRKAEVEVQRRDNDPDEAEAVDRVFGVALFVVETRDAEPRRNTLPGLIVA